VLGGPGGNNLAESNLAKTAIAFGRSLSVEPRASNCKPRAKERKRFPQRFSHEVRRAAPTESLRGAAEKKEKG